jgi:hypothetical protein
LLVVSGLEGVWVFGRMREWRLGRMRGMVLVLV